MGKKISELTSATILTGSEDLPIVQSGNTKKTTTQSLFDGVYSTSEQLCGTWIDGKPLYRQVIQQDSVTLSGGYGTISTTIANVDNVCFYYYSVGTPNSTGRASRQGYLNSDYYNGLQTSTTNTNDLQFSVYAKDGTNTSIKFRGVFWYTKTTDTATRGNVEQLRSTGELVGLGDRAEVGEFEEKQDEVKEVDEPLETKTEVKESGENEQLR